MLMFLSQTVLVRVAIAVMKHRDQKQVGEESVHLACFSTVLFIIKGSQGGNSNRGGTLRQEPVERPRRSATHRLTPHCLLSLLIEPRATSPEIASPTMGRTLLHQSLRKYLTGCPTAWSHGDLFLVEASSSQVTLACVKLTSNSPAHKLCTRHHGQRVLDEESLFSVPHGAAA